jgi:hypothetical protein
MDSMVKALQELEKEFRAGNPHRMVLLMEGPIDTMEHLIRDLKRSLGMENWDNDE